MRFAFGLYIVLGIAIFYNVFRLSLISGIILVINLYLMSLSITDIEYAATLARISLTEEEKSLYLGQFATILTYFDVLSELDVASVEPIYQVTGQENVYREDEVVNASRQKDMVANAPVSDKGSIQVPSVM